MWRSRRCARAAARSARGSCRRGPGARQLRSGDPRAGREPDLRELHPGGTGGGVDGYHGRDPRLARLGRRDPGEGRRLIESSGFMDLVACLLRQAEAVHADETPARAAGGLRYVHLACTAFLTRMHTGDRSADAVDAGGVRPATPGFSSATATTAATATSRTRCTPGAAPISCATCGTFTSSSRENRAGHSRRPACSSRPATPPATARAEGRKALDAGIVAGLTSRYRSIAESGLAVNVYRRTATANDARRIARRILKHEDMILRFITRPDLDIFTNNQGGEDDQAGQGPAAQLRGLLAHPRRPRRLRRRPVLPVHRFKMGHPQDRRAPRPLQRTPLDAART